MIQHHLPVIWSVINYIPKEKCKILFIPRSHFGSQTTDGSAVTGGKNDKTDFNHH